MIFGIGIDLIEIKRFSNIKPSFIKKVFTQQEINYLANKKLESTAGIFVAKEAIAKSLGTGFKFFSIYEIEILHDKKNAPTVKLHNRALKFSKQINITKINISISHTKEMAIAFAIAESN